MEVRKKKGFSQANLAYDANVPVNQIGRIERGEINTTISTLFAIAKALEVDMKTLFEFPES